MAFNPAKLSRKTLKQLTDQVISAPLVIEFKKKLGVPEYEDLKGGIVEFNSISYVQDINFSKYAYILNDANFMSSGTGLQANNRQEIDTHWFQQYNWEAPDPYSDANIDYAVTNYKNGEYADVLLDEKWVNEAFANLSEKQLETLNATRLIIGNNADGYFHRLLPDGTEAKYATLKSLIASAKTDTAITNVDDINLFPTAITNCRNIDLSASSLSDLEVFSQLNNLDYKLANPNQVFQAGNTTTAVYVNQGVQETDIVWICWNSLIEKIKAKNYQFYKELEKLYDEGKLIKIPEASVNLEYQSRDANNNGFAPFLAITPDTLGLAKDEIFMLDKKAWVAFEYKVDSAESEQVTKNNITTTKFTKTQLCAVQDYKPTGSIAVIKVTPLTDLNDNIVP